MSTFHVSWPQRRWPFKYRHECDDILFQDEERTSLLPPSSPQHHGAQKFLPRWYFRPVRLIVLAMTITIGIAMIALGSSFLMPFNKTGGGNANEDVVNARMSYILAYRPKLIVAEDNYDVPPSPMTTPTTVDLPLTLPCEASEIPLEDPVMEG